jgi:hypothetical protein
MESSDHRWVGEIFNHLEFLVCICWWYWSLLCLYILITHIVSGSYSTFSFWYVGFLCNMEVAHRQCEFLKNKVFFCWDMKLMSYSRELQKSFHYTSGVHCSLLCFHANESSFHTVAEHILLLHGKCFQQLNIFSVNMSTGWPWHNIVIVSNMLTKTNDLVSYGECSCQDMVFPFSQPEDQGAVHLGVLWLYCLHGMVCHNVEKVMSGFSCRVSGMSTRSEEW